MLIFLNIELKYAYKLYTYKIKILYLQLKSTIETCSGNLFSYIG